MPDRSISAFEVLTSLPSGTFIGGSGGCRYSVSAPIFNNGKPRKLVAEQLGGGDDVSLNGYDLMAGSMLIPCEMLLDKIVSFLLDLTVEIKPDCTFALNARPECCVLIR